MYAYTVRYPIQSLLFGANGSTDDCIEKKTHMSFFYDRSIAGISEAKAH